MGYPILSNLLYEKSQLDRIAYYEELAANMPPEERSNQWDKCDDYNKGLLTGKSYMSDPFTDGKDIEYDSQYESLLDILKDGTIGSLEFPDIADAMIIYHGTQESVMQKGAGHLYGTSLPVGGKSTHAVLAAHCGLSTKELFTNLDQAEIGDVFFLNILGEKLAYKVDQIKTVLPHETDYIKIKPGEDHVTLLTCTPYGVNSHRLLVRGTRIPYEEAEETINNKLRGIGTWLSMYFKGIAIGLAIAVGMGLTPKFVKYIRKRNRLKAEDTSVHDGEDV